MNHYGKIILKMLHHSNELVMRRQNNSLGTLCACTVEDFCLITRALENSWGTFLASIVPQSCSGPALPFAIKAVGLRFERDFRAHNDEKSFIERLVNEGAELLVEQVNAFLRSNSLQK